MSKRGYISRYLLILKKLKAKPFSTYEELSQYIGNQVDHMQMRDDRLEVGFSKRTFQRDIREINNIFGINIEYSKSEKGYYIHQTEMSNLNFERMMESFDIFNSLRLTKDLSPHIQLEKRRPQGTENLYGLLHAVKNRLKIKFSYQKFWDVEKSERLADPYVLKEFKNRWYILAKDNKDNTVKSFALDRISNFEITNFPFVWPANYNAEESYKYCFGIISPNGNSPQEVVLSFDPFQGKYIKTLPLHETQQIIIDNQVELQIQLNVYVTHDFIMELLSFGNDVKVLQPKSLADEIKGAHQRAFEQY